MTNTLHALQVCPHLPVPIQRLDELASNFWFSWDSAARALFSTLDADLWERTNHNPSLFLRCVDQAALDSAACDAAFLDQYRRVLGRFDSYLTSTPVTRGAEGGELIAYFCAEYGLHESFPIYSGGLGILAGDHCKAASDLALPFVAVGLLYRRGYFNQSIDQHGQQIPGYVEIGADQTPLEPARDPDGQEIFITCAFPGRTVTARVWRAAVGRVEVLLLDTDVAQNNDADQKITHVLYGGDRELRLHQEIILGVGGVKALRAAALFPTVWHMNEGHAAFMIVERVRERVQAGLPFDDALEAVAANSVFTTHTPVAAGHDVFAADILLEHFRGFLPELGIDEETFLALGRHDDVTSFNMTRLAVSGARAVNGVSRIHGRVSSELCRAAWPDIPPAENPVGYVTNGVHVPSFLRPAWFGLLDEHLGVDWLEHLLDGSVVDPIRSIPQERFWATSQQVKSEMLSALRRRLTRQYTRNGLSESHIHRLTRLVDPTNPNVLTVGFARRFATYKRATLLFNDLQWLESIICRNDLPVLFIFAGKAHPADEPGQAMMREIQQVASRQPFIGRILLVEGYDAGLSRLLTSGVDVWLNTPIYPYEASGTSGMKAGLNGTLNLSVLDGWWAEGYDGDNGWAISPELEADSAKERDRRAASALYEILQDEVVPQYYDRDPDLGYSREWVERCRRSMTSVLPTFNSRRLMADYKRLFYVPGSEHGRRVADHDYHGARELAQWKTQVRAAWGNIRLEYVGARPSIIGHGESLQLAVDAELNGLAPDDLRLECILHRRLCSALDTVNTPQCADDSRNRTGTAQVSGDTVAICLFEAGVQSANGTCRYRLDLEPPWTGALEYEIRAVPSHPLLLHPYELGLMRWL